MDIENLLKVENVLLEPKSNNKDDIIKELCNFAYTHGIVGNEEEFFTVIDNREKLGSTGIGKNIAIPHGRCDCVKNLALVFARHKEGIEFESLDGTPAKIFFLLAAPLDVESKYLQVLAHLSRLLREKDFRERLLDAKDPQEILDILNT